MSGRDLFSKFKPIINLLISFFKIFPKKLRVIFLKSIRNINGIKGIGIRYIIIKSINSNIGNNVSIHPGCHLFSIENLSIGDNVSIHPMCYIDATGGINIGSDVSIAHGTTILSTSHSYKDSKESIKYQNIIKKQTKIESNVWIGAKATLLYGVKISEGTVIGAHSLINKDIPKNSLVFNDKKLIVKPR